MIDTSSKLTLEADSAQPVDSAAEIEWMRAAVGGDRAAFGRLVDHHKNSLVGYLVRLTGSADRAEDVAQETFLRLFRSLDRYRHEGKLKALMFRIATNLVRSEQRHRMRWLRLAPILPAALHTDDPSPPDAELLGDEAQRQVVLALNKLPLNYRAVLVLFEIEGHSHAEIADMLGCRPGTVKSRLHRGRAALRAKLESYWRGAPSGNPA